MSTKLTQKYIKSTLYQQVVPTTQLYNMAEIKQTIAFYSHHPEKYAAGQEHLAHFSNFSADPVVYQGKPYKTSEHAFQSYKPLLKKDSERIAACDTPMECAKMGRDRSIPIKEDWDTRRLTVMWEILLCKFTQNEAAQRALLSTGDAYLEERTVNDKEWGSGSDEAGGSGKNMLGKMLMEVRAVLLKY